MRSSVTKEHLILLGVFTAGLIWSVIHPKDLFTWFLETTPALIAVVVLALSYHRFRLTALLYTLLCIHSLILLCGASTALLLMGRIHDKQLYTSEIL